MNVAALSTESQWALAFVAKPVALEGLTVPEVATRLGLPRKLLWARMTKLRAELSGR